MKDQQLEPISPPASKSLIELTMMMSYKMSVREEEWVVKKEYLRGVSFYSITCSPSRPRDTSLGMVQRRFFWPDRALTCSGFLRACIPQPHTTGWGANVLSISHLGYSNLKVHEAR